MWQDHPEQILIRYWFGKKVFRILIFCWFLKAYALMYVIKGGDQRFWTPPAHIIIYFNLNLRCKKLWIYYKYHLRTRERERDAFFVFIMHCIYIDVSVLLPHTENLFVRVTFTKKGIRLIGTSVIYSLKI